MLSTIANYHQTVFFTKTYQDIAFDFEVTFNPYGEIIQVDIPFLKLPETAQKLTVGGEPKKVIERLVPYAKLFRFSVPLALMGYLTGEEWQKFGAKISPSNAVIRRINFKKEITDEWVKKAWKLHYQAASSSSFSLLANLFQNEDSNMNSGLEKIRRMTHPFELVEEVLLALFPFLKNKTAIHTVFATLAKFPNENNYRFLLQQLKDKKQKAYHRTIIIGLLPYQTAELRDFLLDYFSRNRYDAHFYLLTAIVAALKHYPDEEVTDLMFSLLMDDSLCDMAYANLLAFGHNPETIAQKMRGLLQFANRYFKVKCLLMLFKRKITDVSLWPTSNEIIDAYLSLWKAKKYKGIEGLLAKRQDETTLPRLKKLIDSAVIRYRTGAIYEYAELGNIEDTWLIFNCLTKENLASFKHILNALSNLSYRHPNAEIVLPLLELKQQFDTFSFKYELFRVVNTIVRGTSVTDSRLPVLLRAELEAETSEEMKEDIMAILEKLAG